MSVDRRELFTILGAGLVAQTASGQHEHKTPVTPRGSDYKPRVLSATQYETLQRLLDILLPADEISASAKDAGVGMYIDTTLQHGDDKLRASWKAGLDSMKEIANSPGAATQLARLAEAEYRPSTEAERFFVLFKQTAIAASTV